MVTLGGRLKLWSYTRPPKVLNPIPLPAECSCYGGNDYVDGDGTKMVIRRLTTWTAEESEDNASDGCK